MTDLEAEFLNRWRTLAPDMPEPEHDYRFDEVRRWRFDFAFTAPRIAVELEGGAYIQGRHTRGEGFEGDCQKYNAAQAQDWHVFRYTRGMLRDDPAACIAQVRAMLERARMWELAE